MALEPLGIQALAAGVPNFVRDLGSMDSAIGKVGAAGDKLAKDFVGLGNSVLKFGAIAGTAIVGAAGAAGAALLKLAVDAAPLEGVANAFDEITASIGQGSDEMLASLRQSSFGIVTARDLMTSFNLAASLVGTQFAQELPQAFSLLGKVSLATGQDMGFLLNSLVRGVGRLSPLILDNLGIQVNLVEANEAYAKTLGKSASELTKSEQQTALFNQTILKLQENTAALGDPSESAVVAFQRFGVAMKDLRDQIGLELLPAFSAFARRLEPLIQQALPLLVELFRDRIAPAVDRVLSFIGNLVEVLADAGPFSLEFREALLAMLPQEVQDRIFRFAEDIQSWFTRVRDFIIENKDAIIGAIQGIGAALAAAAVVATIAKIASILGLLTSPIGLLLGLIGLLKAGWDTNFMGMRDTLTNFWETTGKPIFDTLVTWLQDNLPSAIQAVSDLFSGELGPALGGVGAFLQPIIDGVQDLVDAFMLHIPSLVEEGGRFASFFSETLGPTVQRIVENIGIFLTALAGFWREHGDEVIDVVGFLVRTVLATFEGFAALVTGIIAGLAALLTGDFEGAVQAITNGIEGLLEAATNVVGVKLDDFLGMWSGILDNLSTIIFAALQGISDGIAGWVQGVSDSIVGGLQGSIDAVADFLGLGSPSRLMMGIGQQMMEGLAAGIRGSTPMPAIALQTAAAQVVGAGPSSTTNMNLTINSASRAEPIAADFQMMQAMAEKI